MKKCCFIIPYFGKLPNYFQLFLNSCKYNPDFNWLLFTDDRAEYEYPENVDVHYIDFEHLKEVFQDKLDFEISLSRPYKLCDYRPLYGYIFEEYINNYSYWGYCDTDTIMGNINRFVEEPIQNNYDKIFCLGHLSLIRNTTSNNQVFKSVYNREVLYKTILKCSNNCWFDEQWLDFKNINQLFLNNGLKVFEKDFSMNVSRKYNRFRRTVFTGLGKANKGDCFEIENYVGALYVWDKGRIIRYYKNNNELIAEEFPYIHLQARKMKVSRNLSDANIYKIVPDEFLPLEVDDITVENFGKIVKYGRCWHTQRILMNKIMRKINNIIKK